MIAPVMRKPGCSPKRRANSPPLLAQCTLYVNAEPCPMCAGAIFWSGVGRVVFGLSSSRLHEVIGNRSEHIREHCAELLARGTHRSKSLDP